MVDAEQLQVQLAGCLMAAEGSKETAPGTLPEYADCPAVRTVHALRAERDALKQKLTFHEDTFASVTFENLQARLARLVADVERVRDQARSNYFAADMEYVGDALGTALREARGEAT